MLPVTRVITRKARVWKMSKRKATTVLVRAPKKFNSTGIFRDLRANQPGINQQIQANRAAAVLVRQARMNAMPVQRAGPNDRGYVDLAAAAYAFNNTGTITLLATIAQGAGVNQRIGKKAMYASIQMRGAVAAGTTGTVSDAAIIFVYDRRPTGALPAITDILVAAAPSAMNNDDNSGRFQIVRRLDFVMIGNITAPAAGGEMFNADMFHKFRRQVVFKAAGTGAIGDIEEGALYLVTCGSLAAGTAAPTSTLSFRVRFTEQ